MAKEENPWKILSTKSVYSNPWIKVVEHKVLNPKGNEGIYGVVKFKNLAIGVVPYDEEGNVWMVGQYRFPLNKYSWEIPEGGGPLGVPALDSAKRELKEETGLEAEHFETLCFMHLSNSVSDEKAIIFLARGLKQGDSEPEETEELQIQKMKLEEVYERIEEGEITDSMTVAAIYKMMLMKKEGKL